MSKVGFVLIFALVSTLTGCFERELSPEQKALLDRLRTDLTSTEATLQSAKEQDAMLNGGLVKAILGVRVEILATNKALLEQRISAIESGAPITQATTVTKPDPELEKTLEQLISEERVALDLAQAEAISYSGLVGAVKAATAATKAQTLAMLEQRYLVVKYGLNPALPSQSGTTETPSSAPAVTQKSIQTPSPEPTLPAANGPFGLEAGLTKEVIEQMVGEKLTINSEPQSLYNLPNPPKPNSAFVHYAVVISPTVGLCQIRAIGKTMDTNSFGHQIKSEFEKLRTTLDSVYGKSEIYDALMPGSIWKQSNDWMMALHKEERSLISQWTSTPQAPLKNKVQSLVLMAQASGSSKAYIITQYSFANHATCEAEQEARATGSL